MKWLGAAARLEGSRAAFCSQQDPFFDLLCPPVSLRQPLELHLPSSLSLWALVGFGQWEELGLGERADVREATVFLTSVLSVL